MHKRSPNNSITKAEIKIFVIMCYYVVEEILTLSTFSYYFTTEDETFSELQSYFMCQSIGIRPDRDCGDAPDIRSQGFIVVATVSQVLQGLLPVVILVFIIDFNAVVRISSKCQNRRRS
jgi:hypothetical protein